MVKQYGMPRSCSALEPILGLRWAPACDAVVRLGFLLSVLSIFPMQVGHGLLPWAGAALWIEHACCPQMWPYRESLSRLCFGQELTGAPFYLLTYASLAAVYLTAMSSSSIWVPLQLVGATAGKLPHSSRYV